MRAEGVMPQGSCQHWKLELSIDSLEEGTRSLDEFEGHGERCKNMAEERCEIFCSENQLGEMLDELRLNMRTA